MKKFKLKYIFISLVLLITIFTCVIFFNVPDLSVEKITRTCQMLTIYDKDSNVSAVLNGGQMRKNITIDNIPQHVINALIATEDVRFYQHNGIDVKRIFGAIISDVTSGQLKEGASTITQQLIKNSHLNNEKKFSRKFNEIILALQLENKFSKDEILEMYFNYIYFGRGAYGIQAASQSYFGIDATELSVSQGATLVGLLKAPSKYAPHINMEKSLLRRNTVLQQMKKYGYISEDEYLKYSAEEIKVVEKNILPDYGYFTDYVLEESAKCLNVSVDDVLKNGYNIYTSMDSDLQKKLQNIYENEDNFIDENVQSASVVIDNSSGAISAMIGGRTHKAMRIYNRATSRRQPGSTIKPILVFGPAFENKSISALTVLEDSRKNFAGYTPTNYKNQYYGNVTVRKALSLSLNVPAVEILNNNGIEYSKSYAEKAGIVFAEEDDYLALALGGMRYGVSPLEIAGAYSMLANSGEYTKPYCILKITDSNGNILYSHKTEKSEVFSDSTAFILTDILCDVSKQKSNGHSLFKENIASKTGTVGYNDLGHSDAWSVGYVKSHTVSVWMGYDTTTEKQFLPYSVTGSSLPSKISAQIFSEIFDIYGYEDFVKPETVKKLKIDGYSLKNNGKIYLATDVQTDVVYEYFDEENCPQTSNAYWERPELPQNITVQLNELRQAEISFVPENNYTVFAIIRKNSFGEEVIAKIPGNNKKIIFTDEEYFLGDSYIIQPIHKEIFVDGKPYVGQRSIEYRIY